jgi:penicillin G amidase
MEIVWGDQFLIGASMPGCPLIGLGRSKNISWGMTAPLSDSSDLWQELISDDGNQYYLDGVW